MLDTSAFALTNGNGIRRFTREPSLT